MNMFDEISKVKRDFPKVNSIASEVSHSSLNFYQIVAVGLFILGLCLGIVFGNLFSTCEATSYFYSDACVNTEFNFSVMLLIWFFGSILSLFIFSIGHIIALLQQIIEKLGKK